jgi:hypothetical protein
LSEDRRDGPSRDDVLGWCTPNGFGRGHCIAKIVSTTHPIDGSTKFN